jgi:phosphotriesterase-related protein
MKVEDRSGKVQTVLGLIEPDSLGITLPHEHLVANGSRCYFCEPEQENDKWMAHAPVSLDNLWWLRYNTMNNRDNFDMSDVQLISRELLRFKDVGGRSVVELTSDDHGRDAVKLKKISESTGVNVIMGAGFYVAASHSDEVLSLSEAEMADRIVRDITVGVGDTGIRAGIIGEIGCTAPLHDNERKALRAAAVAQRRTGAPLNIHPSKSDELLLENVGILKDAGADMSRVVISHVDGDRHAPGVMKKLAEDGYYLEFDTFGYEHWMVTKYWHKFLPSDTQRVDEIMELIAAGHLKQILMSHDIYFKHTLTAYAGAGYSHILRNVVPLMRAKGVTDEMIHTIMVENPKRMLTFAPPAA